MKAAGPVVLLVDDDVDSPYAPFLRREGFTVETALEGAEGIARAIASPPSILVMDLRMPGVDGFEATRRLRENPRTSRVPVIVLTGCDDDEARGRAMAAGADLYRVKPCAPDVLLASILHALQAHRRERSA